MNYLIVILLVLLSGLFSGLTLGLFSLDLTSLERKIKLGDKRAKRIYPVRKNGNLLLCTLLLGNVAVNSTMAIFLGTIADGVVAGVISTALIVIFGEIIPQAAFSRFALSVGAYTAWLVRIFMYILFPVTFPLAFILDRVLGKELPTIFNKNELAEIIKSHEDSPHSRIDNDEEKIILGALSFSDKVASEIMTPRTVIYAIDGDRKVDSELINEIKESGYSRIPIYKETPDNIQGILFVKTLIGFSNHQKTALEVANTSNMLYVKEDIKLDRLFNLFLAGKMHISFLFDDFGILQGIVTLEDVIEEIINREILDENDDVSDMQKLAKERFKKKLQE